MFLGRNDFTLDSKGRLTIPAKHRPGLMPMFIVTRNPMQPNLMVMPMARWEALAARLAERPLTHRPTAELRRFLFGSAEDLTPDAQGRIILSPLLRTYAQIEDQVAILGMHDYLEIWNPTLYDEHNPARPHPSNETLETWAEIGI